MISCSSLGSFFHFSCAILSMPILPGHFSSLNPEMLSQVHSFLSLCFLIFLFDTAIWSSMCLLFFPVCCSQLLNNCQVPPCGLWQLLVVDGFTFDGITPLTLLPLRLLIREFMVLNIINVQQSLAIASKARTRLVTSSWQQIREVWLGIPGFGQQ